MHGGQEPAIRQQLRAARAAEKHAKMKAALAEKQQKEAEETTRREQQQQHKQAHRERIDAWKNKNKVRRARVPWCAESDNVRCVVLCCVRGASEPSGMWLACHATDGLTPRCITRGCICQSHWF
jgi:hypothetical protein